MHEFLESPADVLAVKLSGTITGEDLDLIMDRTEAILAAHRTIHVYVETHGLDGIQLSALPHYMGRAMPLFGKRGRFRRVAVVAEQRWVRASSRLESALLPGITYLVVGPDRREEALAWALKGEEPLP
ncbi:STAS/SEC14 domain-containing protein [Sphingomonas sp. HDW15A]|uniref:STAS/SEC14 domain-containing protein n=1 Tax=Sphingomonas sp. HDW15A TaxID=2714942 RepID=UPI001409C86A|nr:STAS/SEC14 domain-containing protein [Sphingomonas sp. HDW15A]QIK96123.1 STAS/SEC14 domain-containing protein [Sphingomonas sp. HDW15A]